MNPTVIKAKTAKPLDRRARRTRQAIKESFSALAANRPLPDLTVKEVMERVIERTTRMRESEEHREGDLAVALVCLLDDRDACRWLLGPQSLGTGKAVLADHLRQRYLQQILATDGMTELRARCLFDYAFEGAFGVLLRCHGQGADPRETLSVIRDLLTGALTFPW